jgi:hypothetical protein
MLLDGDKWKALFEGFARSAWRLETLPAYNVPEEEEELSAFLRGERISNDYQDEWTQEIANHVRHGRTMGRVHVITRPLTNYLRFEFMYYRPQVRAGEEVRILDITDRDNPLEGVQDFWIFDENQVVLMNYEPDGSLKTQELHEGEPTIYQEYQRIALAESVPLEEYLTHLDA